MYTCRMECETNNQRKSKKADGTGRTVARRGPKYDPISGKERLMGLFRDGVTAQRYFGPLHYTRKFILEIAISYYL